VQAREIRARERWPLLTIFFLYIIDDKGTGAYLTEATSEILGHHGVEDGVEAGVRVGHHVGHHLVHMHSTLYNIIVNRKGCLTYF
jgi:hypothetical protein